MYHPPPLPRPMPSARHVDDTRSPGWHSYTTLYMHRSPGGTRTPRSPPRRRCRPPSTALPASPPPPRCCARSTRTATGAPTSARSRRVLCPPSLCPLSRLDRGYMDAAYGTPSTPLLLPARPGPSTTHAQAHLSSPDGATAWARAGSPTRRTCRGLARDMSTACRTGALVRRRGLLLAPHAVGRAHAFGGRARRDGGRAVWVLNGLHDARLSTAGLPRVRWSCCAAAPPTRSSTTTSTATGACRPASSARRRCSGMRWSTARAPSRRRAPEGGRVRRRRRRRSLPLSGDTSRCKIETGRPVPPRRPRCATSCDVST